MVNYLGKIGMDLTGLSGEEGHYINLLNEYYNQEKYKERMETSKGLAVFHVEVSILYGAEDSSITEDMREVFREIYINDNTDPSENNLYEGESYTYKTKEELIMLLDDFEERLSGLEGLEEPELEDLEESGLEESGLEDLEEPGLEDLEEPEYDSLTFSDIIGGLHLEEDSEGSGEDEDTVNGTGEGIPSTEPTSFDIGGYLEEFAEGQSQEEHETGEEFKNTGLISVFEKLPLDTTPQQNMHGEIPLSYAVCIERDNGEGEVSIEIIGDLNQAIGYLERQGYTYDDSVNLFYKKVSEGVYSVARVYIDVDFRGVV